MTHLEWPAWNRKVTLERRLANSVHLFPFPLSPFPFSPFPLSPLSPCSAVYCLLFAVYYFAQIRMTQLDSHKDYYDILGATERTTARDLERLYKRRAARCHPDRGGSEEEMKSLNEAYSVLRNATSRNEYDAKRAKPATAFVPVSAPTAHDVGLLGHGLSAFFCLLTGVFLLVLVRSQWIWFLWPLGILAALVIVFGIMMARSTMHAISASLPPRNLWRRHSGAQEVAFWCVVAGCLYGLYLLLTAL